MSDITEDEKIWRLKGKTLLYAAIILLGFAITSTFTAALIYFEFLDVKKDLKALQALHEEDVTDLMNFDDEDYEKTNDRLDKKTSRNKAEIDKLKEKGSDIN